MQKWQGEAFIISQKFLKQGSYLCHLFSKEKGLHAGVFKNSSKKMQEFCQGNLVFYKWQARLEEHIGSLQMEVLQANSFILQSQKLHLQIFNEASRLIRKCLCEGEASPKLYATFQEMMDKIRHNNISHNNGNQNEELQTELIKLKLALLTEQGFGFDHTSYYEKGKKFIYISPKTGALVTANKARGYETKLIPLCELLSRLITNQKNGGFLANNIKKSQEISQAMAILDYFIEKHFKNSLKALPNA